MRFDEALQLLPPNWRITLAGHGVEPMSGMSGASVFRLSDVTGGCRYLKLASGPDAESLRQEITRTEWLSSHHIRVPEFLMKIFTNEVAAVLMTAVPGRHLSGHQASGHPAPRPGDLAAMVRTIGRGLARLHALPAAGCPFDEMPRTRLRRARAAIDCNLIDAREFDDRNAGITPAALCQRLDGTIPEREEIVVVHGDATLENMLIGVDGELGFIDCGHAGRSDRYLDLALVEADLREAFGRDAAEDFTAAYGVRRWDDRKAAFFRDLYELF